MLFASNLNTIFLVITYITQFFGNTVLYLDGVRKATTVHGACINLNMMKICELVRVLPYKMNGIYIILILCIPLHRSCP